VEQPTATPSERASPGPEPTPAAEPPAASAKADRARGRPMGVALRVVAIVIILAAMFGLGHVLRHPVGEGGAGAGAGSAAWPPEVDASGDPPPPDARPTTEQEARDDLRHLMAGLLMVAAGDDDAPDGEPPADPSTAQRRVADWFGLPYNYPASAAPAGLVPPDAEVLMVIGGPERQESRMVLVRVRKGIDAALETFYRHYRAMGWEAETLKSPSQQRDAQPDRGWLVRFAKGRQERLLYARSRAEAEETVLAIYEPNYEGD